MDWNDMTWFALATYEKGKALLPAIALGDSLYDLHAAAKGARVTGLSKLLDAGVSPTPEQAADTGFDLAALLQYGKAV